MAQAISVISYGADVDSRFIQINCHGESAVHKIENSRCAIRAWLKSITGPARLAVESTGAYHMELADQARLSRAGVVHGNTIGNPDTHEPENQDSADLQNSDERGHALDQSITGQIDQEGRQYQRHPKKGNHATALVSTKELHGVRTKGAGKKALSDYHRKVHKQGIESRWQSVSVSCNRCAESGRIGQYDTVTTGTLGLVERLIGSIRDVIEGFVVCLDRDADTYRWPNHFGSRVDPEPCTVATQLFGK